jgi:hypothetical protein
MEWEPQGVPLAVGALGLLSHITSLNDEVWFDLSCDPNWMREEYEIELPCLEFTISSSQLETAAQNGFKVLRDVSPSLLSSFYADLLAGNGPSLLSGNTQPLPPEALAALLLPGREQECARWSLAGWEPSRTDYWAGIACSNALQQLPAQPAGENRTEFLDRAQMIAEAIVTDSPELANGPGEQVRALLAFARDPRRRWVDAEELPDSSLATLSRAESELLADTMREIRSTDVPDYLRDVDDDVRHGFQLDLQKKAAVHRAWWLMITPSSQLSELTTTSKFNDKVTVSEVLREWAKTSRKAGELLAQVTEL